MVPLHIVMLQLILVKQSDFTFCFNLQGSFNLLFKPESQRQKGVLAYLKCLIRQTPVCGRVMENFDPCQDFMELATDGYILTLALNLLGLKKLQDKLDNIAPEDRHVKLCETSAAIVDFCFIAPDVEAIQNATGDADEAYSFCVCKEDLGGDMVLCCNKKCEFGGWFHLECKDMEPEDVPPDDEPWYCSAACHDKQNSRTKKSRRETTRASQPTSDVDHKMEYSKAVMYHGLFSLCRRDAIRENDGPRMLLHWRFDMLRFFTENHPKYFIFGHRLLTDTAGGASEALAFQLTWNRTINVHGGEGKNIAADLHMEHLNNGYKSSIKAAGGQLTDDTIARHSQMLGMQHELSQLFGSNVAATHTHHRRRGDAKHTDDICTIVRVLQREKLLEEIPGRCHAGFEGFLFHHNVPDYDKLRKRILRHQLIQYKERRKMLHKRDMAARRLNK